MGNPGIVEASGCRRASVASSTSCVSVSFIGILTRVRTLKTGNTVGGIPFTRGPLAYLLRNRFYVGEVVFKGETLRGEQPAILDREPAHVEVSQQW